ncbi:MAG: hypothetical protein ACRBBN_02465 [Methyloligellaceae bacterium]
MRFIITLLLTIFTTSAVAETLTTDNYVIVIKRNCPEGYVTCDNVSYSGLSKKSGQTIRLKGSTIHTTCADGTTPCRFIGYEFKNNGYTYTVFADGRLQVQDQTDRVLVGEQGNWSD